MKGRIECKYWVPMPDEIPFTLTITMTLGDWKRLKKQMPSGSFPSWRLDDIIRKLVSQAEETLVVSGEYGDETD